MEKQRIERNKSAFKGTRMYRKEPNGTRVYLNEQERIERNKNA